MVKLLVLILLIVVTSLGANSPSWAGGQKFALIVANSAYSNGLSPLANPSKDADVMAQALQHAGFAVTVIRDADLETMQRAVIDQAERLRAAGEGTVSFIHYSGHGAAGLDRTEDYLIPVGAKISSELSLPTRAYKLTDLLRTIAQARPAVNFVAIDACRDVAFPHSIGRSVERGLAKVDGVQGTLIAFATAPDKTAEDGADGLGSTFSSALAAEIAKGGESHIDVFKNVQIAVAAATGNRQVPWYTDGIVGRYIFKSDGAGPVSKSVADPSAHETNPSPTGLGPDSCLASDVVPISRIMSPGFARSYERNRVKTAAQFMSIGPGNWLVRGIDQNNYIILSTSTLDQTPSSTALGVLPIFVAIPRAASDVAFSLRQGDLIALDGVTHVEDNAESMAKYTAQINSLKALGADVTLMQAALENIRAMPPNIVFVAKSIARCPG